MTTPIHPLECLPVRLVLLLCMTCFSTICYSAEEEEEHRNEISVTLSVVHEGGENDTAVGLDYERRINESFGVGLLIERIWAAQDATIYALPITGHVGQWKLVVAPGVEKSQGESEKWLRLSAGYEFEVDRSKITPFLAVDFVDGETLYVLGVAIGFGF